MRFTDEAVDKIDRAYHAKLRENPVRYNIVGLNGFEILHDGRVCGVNGVVCEYEDLARTIEELSMLLEAVKETVGVY